MTGVHAHDIAVAAEEFSRNQPGLAIAGTGAATGPDGAFHCAAVALLNVLAGNVGKPGGVSFPNRAQAFAKYGAEAALLAPSPESGYAGVRAALEKMRGGRVPDGDPLGGDEPRVHPPASAQIRRSAVEGPLRRRLRLLPRRDDVAGRPRASRPDVPRGVGGRSRPRGAHGGDHPLPAGGGTVPRHPVDARRPDRRGEGTGRRTVEGAAVGLLPGVHREGVWRSRRRDGEGAPARRLLRGVVLLPVRGTNGERRPPEGDGTLHRRRSEGVPPGAPPLPLHRPLRRPRVRTSRGSRRCPIRSRRRCGGTGSR